MGHVIAAVGLGIAGYAGFQLLDVGVVSLETHLVWLALLPGAAMLAYALFGD